MIEIITTLLNRVEEERQILLQSTETTINSLYEGGGSKQRKNIQESQTGRNIHNKYSVQRISNCKEDPE